MVKGRLLGHENYILHEYCTDIGGEDWRLRPTFTDASVWVIGLEST